MNKSLKKKKMQRRKRKMRKTLINIKRLKKLLKEKSNSNDFTYFKKMDLEEQKNDT